MLARGENLIVTKEAFQVMKEPLIMTEDRLCSVCNRGFSDPVFLRYPNNLVAHVHCGQNKRFCEMTGRVIATTN
jgi:hydrogenase maturation factor HypF (carbamoyltransferase family)